MVGTSMLGGGASVVEFLLLVVGGASIDGRYGYG